MGNADGDLAERSQEADNDGWCPYCGADDLDDKAEHVEREHL